MKLQTLVVIVVLLVFFVAPIVLLVGYPLSQNPVFYIRFLLNDAIIGDALVRSLMLATFVTLGALVLAALLAVGFIALPIRRAALLRLLLLAPLILPPFVGGMAIRKLLSRYGPVNLLLIETGLIVEPIDFIQAGGLAAIAVTEILHFYPVIFLSIWAALLRFDARSWEAARLVGASRVACITHIVFPLVAPSLLASCSAVFVWSFADISTPLVFDYRGVLPVQLLELLDELNTNPYGFWISGLVLVITVTWFLAVKNSLAAVQSASAKGSETSLKSVGFSKAWTACVAFKLFAMSVILFALLPHCMVALMALGDRWWFTALPSSYSFTPFIELLGHPLSGPAIRNSLLLSSVATLLNLALAWAAATALMPNAAGRINVKGGKRSWLQRVLSVLVVSPLAVPGLLLALGTLALFSGTMLDPRQNPIPLLIIGYAIKRLPFSVQTIEAGLLIINHSAIEAARLCGASQLRITIKIILPLVAPFIISCAALCFASSMLEVSESFILALKEPYYPITKAMYALLARPDGERMAAALGTVSMVLIAACLAVSSYADSGRRSSGVHG